MTRVVHGRGSKQKERTVNIGYFLPPGMQDVSSGVGGVRETAGRNSEPGVVLNGLFLTR